MASLTTTDEVQSLLNFDVTTAVMTQCITDGDTQLRAEINVNVDREKIRFIATDRENKIDGTETTFWTRFWPLADRDSDGTIDDEDVTCFSVDSNGDRADVTVTVADGDTGQLLFSSAPSTDYVYYLNYAYAGVTLAHELVGKAASEIAAVYCCDWKLKYSSMNVAGMGTSMALKEKRDQLYKRYKETVRLINTSRNNVLARDGSATSSPHASTVSPRMQLKRFA